jgi:high frequency lysogenization protein
MYLRKQLVGDIFTRSQETRRYFASLIELSKKLQSDSEVSSQIQESLNQLNDSYKNMELTTDDLVSELSNIYTKTLSKFEPRIVVNGENTHLTVPLQASRIRTALFAGLRSVLLWQQSGGSKLKMFIFQSRIAKKIDEYLKY